MTLQNGTFEFLIHLFISLAVLVISATYCERKPRNVFSGDAKKVLCKWVLCVVQDEEFESLRFTMVFVIPLTSVDISSNLCSLTCTFS